MIGQKTSCTSTANQNQLFGKYVANISAIADSMVNMNGDE